MEIEINAFARASNNKRVEICVALAWIAQMQIRYNLIY